MSGLKQEKLKIASISCKSGARECIKYEWQPPPILVQLILLVRVHRRVHADVRTWVFPKKAMTKLCRVIAIEMRGRGKYLCLIGTPVGTLVGRTATESVAVRSCLSTTTRFGLASSLALAPCLSLSYICIYPPLICAL